MTSQSAFDVRCEWGHRGLDALADPGTRSPEAAAAVAAFEVAAASLRTAVVSCSSGMELVQRGFPQDVDFAAELDVCAAAPELIDGA